MREWISRRRAALRGQQGQTATELMGMILVVSAIVGVIASSDIDGQISRGVARQVCVVLGDSCATEDDEKEAAKKKGRDGDDDGLSDREEGKRGTRPGRADSDRDKLTDGDEVERGTNPLDGDSDGDGMTDGREVKSKRDPKKRGSGSD